MTIADGQAPRVLPGWLGPEWELSMAITLPDGTHAESGGLHGTFELGGTAAGADDSQFDHHAYLPINDTYPQGQANGMRWAVWET